MKKITLLLLLFVFGIKAQENIFIEKSRVSILSKNLNAKELDASIIKINEDVLDTESFTFNPFKNLNLIVDKKSHVNKSSWVGTFRDKKLGYFILSKAKGEFYGKAVLENGDFIIIKKASNSNYRVSRFRQIEEQEDCVKDIEIKKESDEGSNYQTKNYGVDICDTSATCNDVVIDVLVLYTDDVLDAQISVASVEGAIQNAMDEANLVISNTNLTANHRLNLKAVVKLDFAEDPSGDSNLTNFRSDLRVINLRNKYSADIVALILNGGGCGRGYVNFDKDAYEASAGYSITRWDCMTGNLTLTHEMGHNFGFRHDAYVNTSTSVICDYGLGYINANANASSPSSRKWRTVMAYNTQCSDNGFNCTRLPYFSNPDNKIGTDAMGLAAGNINAANNKEVFERAACHVAEFAKSPSCTDCDVYQNCVNYSDLFSNGPGNSLKIEVSDSFKTVDPSANVQICLNLFGDNNSRTEQFNVLNEDGTVMGGTTIGKDCDIPTRTCFTVSGSDYNKWITDGTLSVTIDPSDTGINPVLCSQNYACVEVVVEKSTLSTNAVIGKTISEIYPNPTSTEINIKSKGSIKNISLYNSFGKLILLNKRESLNKIDISQLSKGVYFLEVVTDIGREVKKVIKK